MQPAGTWLCCGIKPTEIGWMCSIDPATADKRCWRATSDNHREPPRLLAQSPPPTAHCHCHCHCYIQCLLHRGSWVECGGRSETLVARLRFSSSRRFSGAFDSLSVVTVCTPSLGTETELQSAVCGQQSATHHLAHSSSVIYHHATQRDTGRGQTAPPRMHAAGWSSRPGQQITVV